MTSNPDIPLFIGYIETTMDALRIILAARLGIIPRITRRLNDSERRTMIKSGAVFVFSVEESGIKRWTGILWFRSIRAPRSDSPLWDGRCWSPSRIIANFLVSFRVAFNVPSVDLVFSPGLSGDHREDTWSQRTHIHKTTHLVATSLDATLQTSYPTRALQMATPAVTKAYSNQMAWSRRCARALNQRSPFSDEGFADNNSYDWRLRPSSRLILHPGGRTFRRPQSEFCSCQMSIRSDDDGKRPTSRSDIMSLPMPPHLFRLTNFRVPPKIEIGPDGTQGFQ